MAVKLFLLVTMLMLSVSMFGAGLTVSTTDGTSTNQFLEQPTNHNATLIGTTAANGPWSGPFAPLTNAGAFDAAGSATAATNGWPWGTLYDASGAAHAATNGYPWGTLYDVSGAAHAVTNGYPWLVLSDAAGSATAATNNYPWLASQHVVTNNFQPVFTNGGWFITNASGWTFQGANGLYVSSNAANSTCLVIDSNRNTIWLSNNIVVASNNATTGNFTTVGQITVNSNLTASSSGASWFAPSIFSAGTASGPDFGAPFIVLNSRVAIGLQNGTADLAVLDGSNQNVRQHAYLMSGPNWGGTFLSEGNLAVGTNNVASHGALEVWGNGWFTGGVTASSFTGDGSALTGLNASSLASGTVPLAQIPTSVVTNNYQIVFTNGGWYTTNNKVWSYHRADGFEIMSNAANSCYFLRDTNGTITLGSNNVQQTIFSSIDGSITMNGLGQLSVASGTDLASLNVNGSSEFDGDVTVNGVINFEQDVIFSALQPATGRTNIMLIDDSGHVTTNDLANFVSSLGTDGGSGIPWSSLYIRNVCGSYSPPTSVYFGTGGDGSSASGPAAITPCPVGLRTQILTNVCFNFANSISSALGAGSNAVLRVWTNVSQDSLTYAMCGSPISFIGDGTHFATNSGTGFYVLPGGPGRFWCLSVSNANASAAFSSCAVDIHADVITQP